jgi:lipopolysaccharide export LptBFGC system permease protein LptF
LLTLFGASLTEVFEMCFLLCFAVAWPVNIMKSLRSRTARGRSVGFEILVVIGYLFGIAAKLVDDHISYVIIFYIINTVLVLIDIALYFRNARLDRVQSAQNATTLNVK